MIRRIAFRPQKNTTPTGDQEYEHQIAQDIAQYNYAVAISKKQFLQPEIVRQKAKNAKWKAIQNLEKNLESFEKHLTAKGAQVHWAETALDANNIIGKICQEKKTTCVVKAKTFISEELKLNDYLRALNIQPIETTLETFFRQLEGVSPSQMSSSLLGKNAQDLSILLNDKLKKEPYLSPEQITKEVSKELRNTFGNTTIGISEADFILPDTGALAFSENEGNGRLVASIPKTQIVLVGIEKMLNSYKELQYFWPLLSTSSTGQKITTYNTLIAGPGQSNQTEGPEELHIILIDNGRTAIMKDPIQRESLYCIRCGACRKACPIYKTSTGQSNIANISGPIESIISPGEEERQRYQHLSYNCSLCGACDEACPMHISLSKLILKNRELTVQQKGSTFKETIGWRIWSYAMLYRKALNLGDKKLKEKVFEKLFSTWTEYKKAPEFAPHTFNQYWKEKQKGKKTSLKSDSIGSEFPFSWKNKFSNKNK